MVLILCLIAVFAVMLGRVYLPWIRSKPSRIVRRAPLSVLAKLRLHRGPAIVVVALAIAGWGNGWLPWTSVLAVGVSVLLMIAVPVAYTLTPDGIRLGQTPLRRWTEFGGVSRRPGGVRMQGVTGARGLTVWLSGPPTADDEFVLLLRQLVRGSYQGRLRHATFEPTPPSESPLDAAAAMTALQLDHVQLVGS